MNHRYISSAPLGLLMAGALLWLMQILIATAPGALTEPRKRYELDWVFVAPKEVINKDEQKIDRLPPPVQPPRFDHPTDPVDPVTVPTPIPPDPVPDEFRPGDFGQSNSPLVDVMYVRPVYPPDAAARGLEGFVTVKFDVTELGTVTNVRVLESSHRVFEKAAREAALRSKFRPRVVDGVARLTPDILRRYRFEMDQ